MPFYSPYAATKAVVRQFSESLRRELNAYPIHVMTVYPIATDTPMMHTASTTDMDTPEYVANCAIKGMLHKEIDVKMGGEALLKDQQLNFENPLAYDEKVRIIYAAMEKRAANHRSM